MRPALPVTTSDQRDWNRKTAQAVNELRLPAKGVTADRPANVATGYVYFDTTLGLPVWWDGAGWVDATGTTA